MARDPDTRPRSCALLAEAFERMLEHGRPVDDAGVARWYEEVLPARRDTFRRWADGAPPALAELRQLLGPVPFEAAPQSLIPTTHDELARERSHLFDVSHAAGPAVGGASGEPIPGHTTVEAAGGTKTEGPLELAWRSEEGRDRHLTGEDLLIRERAHHDVADERLPRLSGAARAADVSAPVDAGPPPRRPQSRWVVALALAAALLLVGALALALAVRPLHEGREAPPRTGEHASVPVSPSPAAPDRKAAAASALRQGPVLFVIESSPPGAEIRLAGRRVGTTPWVGQAEVPSPFELELRLDGWRPWHRRLERPATRELKIAARLTPKRQ
ncbi:MAG: PEGA domain-containing protein [Deltaproteobacteria bacterium]|nr:MAG: PEGA domain-containing protein [Deltaproteobacteria bacterium]